LVILSVFAHIENKVVLRAEKDSAIGREVGSGSFQRRGPDGFLCYTDLCGRRR